MQRALRFITQRGICPAAALWLLSLPCAAPVGAAPSIHGYTPAAVAAGGRVTMEGTGFGDKGTKRVTYGQGDRTLGDVDVTASDWRPTQILVTVPGSVAAGTYWLAIVDRRGGLKARGPEALRIRAGRSGGGPRPPLGTSVVPRTGDDQADRVEDTLRRARTDLAIVGVSPRQGSAVPVFGGQVAVTVRVRNLGSAPARFRVSAPNSFAPNGSLAISELQRLDPGAETGVRIRISADVSRGLIRHAVALGTTETPREFPDTNPANNSLTVNYIPRYGADLTITDAVLLRTEAQARGGWMAEYEIHVRHVGGRVSPTSFYVTWNARPGTLFGDSDGAVQPGRDAVITRRLYIAPADVHGGAWSNEFRVLQREGDDPNPANDRYPVRVVLVGRP